MNGSRGYNAKQNKLEKDKPRNRLLSIEKKLMVTRKKVGGEWVKQVMWIQECTCDEYQVMYGSTESLYYIPKTNIKL